MGYGFFIADEWSVGPEAHFVYASLSEQQGDIKLSHRWLAPGIAMVFTHH